VRQAARAAGSMISRTGVTDKRRKPGVSQAGQPKDNIRSNPGVTPRAALGDITYRRDPVVISRGTTGRVTTGASRQLQGQRRWRIRGSAQADSRPPAEDRGNAAGASRKREREPDRRTQRRLIYEITKI
jgi:hypothetical protein